MPPILFPVNISIRGRAQQLGVGPSPQGLLPLPAVVLHISGVTRDSTGAVLVSCTVELYLTANDMPLEKVVSDPVTGAYSFSSIGLSETYYVVAYKAGATDVAGTTVNTLIGA